MTLSFGPCYARLENDLLTIGNATHIERTWRLTEGSGGGLAAVSLLDKKTGTQWLRPSETPEAQAMIASATLSGGEESHAVQNPCLHIVLTMGGKDSDAPQKTYHFRVFPDAPAIGITLDNASDGGAKGSENAAAAATAQPTGVELSDAAAATNAQTAEPRDILEFAPPHLRFTQAALQDQTDHHNELVFESEWLLQTNEAPFALSGNVFSVENPLNQNGLVFLIAAPLPYARPEKTDLPDVRVWPANRRIALRESGYETTAIAYSNGKWGRIAALQNYQRQIRPYVAGRDGMLISNTWGDRNRDGRINHDFLLEEIDAAARLGVDVMQIDDGWQKGTTSNSINADTQNGVWEGFHNADPQFWDANATRLPHGLAPLVKAARDKGMRFGLWFAPDSHQDFANHDADADALLRLHREQNIDYIKIDGVKLRTLKGQHNLRAFFDRVLEGSQGRVVFDGDVTAEVRFGYFGIMDVGPLFLENRYTDWHRYWPHHTLRSLWKLSHYVDPLRLRMEFLNHARNTDKYPDDPLAPITYRADYLFATVMFASPLGWFEVSNLPPAYFDDAAPLIAVWKAHRDALHGGTLLPIGDTPDGVSWTGFASVAPDRKSVYLLIFREKNPSSSATLDVPLLDAGSAKPNIEILAGDGGVVWAGTETGGVGSVTAHIPDEQRFVFARLTMEADAAPDVPIPAP